MTITRGEGRPLVPLEELLAREPKGTHLGDSIKNGPLPAGLQCSQSGDGRYASELGGSRPSLGTPRAVLPIDKLH
jgi:hypothetical protein